MGSFVTCNRYNNNMEDSTQSAASVSQEAEMALYEVHGLDIGTMVQFGDPPRYGVIRWIGKFPGGVEQLAGIELEEFVSKGCGDGSFEGVHYFNCEFGHGYFHPLKNVRPDERFVVINALPPNLTQEYSKPGENPLQAPLMEDEDQPVVPPPDRYLGERRGIQGHYNSCYIDSSLFGLFALTNVFDSIFLGGETQPGGGSEVVSQLIAKNIVNPLRKNGVVRYESVMELRHKIEDLGKMVGGTQYEKDPEELLNLLFKKILHVPPFIQIRRSFGVEDEFFVQLFMAFDENLRLPTIRELTRRMFDEQNLSLTEAPSRLLIQVPRYGRQFKTCQRIVSDLKFEVSEFTEEHRAAASTLPECIICGERSSLKCSICKSDFITDEEAVYFCEICSNRAHCVKKRTDHRLLRAVDIPVAELDLLSVICIETSHYVCFTRDLNSKTWLFFDSMADRLNNQYNIPRVTECTVELNEWVYSGDLTKLLSAQPRQLPKLVRRFTQDVYMCIYVNQSPDDDRV